ncbi:threonine/serine ThrE exporter family protein [Methanobacterium aggregans]|uniref:threonine/serine ThrE exporter family protein n=1 Tax=Methanobacterium aggregans TaxID=1615586 RepID=UPI001FDA861D|nr:threonine/serine exporter family protein [Methanobacterium aggregans]MBP2047040.1 uncharacterized membrane protein YjjP (DUF1212 family) [Methanobacterium aggregans]
MKGTEVPSGLLEFLTKLGKALASAGISVVDVTAILKRIASAYRVESEILVFPTMILIKIGEHESAPITAANPKPGLIPLNQVSELYELIYKAENAELDPKEGVKRIKEILSEKHLFGPLGIIVGYILFSVGIGLLMQPSPEQLLASGILGGLVGTLILFGENKSQFSLILPVTAALLVSCLFFWGVKEGLIVGSFVMLIPSLAYFLPGATLTTGMFELASGEIVSGASRVIYGAAILLLLLFGVILGLQIMGLPSQELVVLKSATLGWWAPYLGILIFAVGMYLFMSIRSKDLPWVILILYIAFIGQQIGNYLIGGFFGGFVGSLLMAVSGTIIEQGEHKTPSFVSILPAFWVLVPGSLGFISLATLAGQNLSASVTSGLLMILTIVSISLGLLVGAVVTEPLKNRRII